MLCVVDLCRVVFRVVASFCVAQSFFGFGLCCVGLYGGVLYCFVLCGDSCFVVMCCIAIVWRCVWLCDCCVVLFCVLFCDA